MQTSHVCWLSHFFLGPAVVPPFLNSRIATGDHEHVCDASESFRIFPRDKNPDHEM